jgi:hypothetical protein
MLTIALMTCITTACNAKKPGEGNSSKADNTNANAQQGSQAGLSGGKGAGGKLFRGAVAESALQMNLNREGDKLTGTYFYQKIGSDISLKGSINGQGDFTLQEFDNSGKQTGEFKGKWTEPSNLPSAVLEGTWAKPNSKDTLFFYATEQTIEFHNGLRVVPKENREQHKKKNYSVQVDYPELSGAQNPNADKFNQEIKTMISKETAEFKQGAVEVSAEDTPGNPDGGSSLYTNFDVMLATDDLISVVFDVSDYSQGAAHPNNYAFVVNYDLKSGKLLKLADLFKPGSDYLNVISQFAISDLKKNAGQGGYDNEWVEKGAGPESDNYSDWNISKKGLVITFDPYQVGSYAEGTKHVLVPYSALKDIIRSDGPIASIGN